MGTLFILVRETDLSWESLEDVRGDACSLFWRKRRHGMRPKEAQGGREALGQRPEGREGGSCVDRVGKSVQAEGPVSVKAAMGPGVWREQSE